jgi:hypothetical protein
VGVEGDNTRREPKADRRTDIEDEATTVWGKADLFDGVEAEEEEDDLFGESGDSGNAPGRNSFAPRQVEDFAEPVTGPVRLDDVNDEFLAGDAEQAASEEAPADDDAATVEMTAEQAAQLVAEAASGHQADNGAATPPLEASSPEAGLEQSAPDTDPNAPPPSGEFLAPQVPQDHAVSDEPLVQVSGDEGAAAAREAEARALELESDPTRVVKKLDRPLTHDCRMCGRKVATPEPRRFRGSKSGVHGFHCDRCGNTFCAAHVVRVSSLLGSLFGPGVFRCQLCDLDD